MFICIENMNSGVMNVHNISCAEYSGRQIIFNFLIIHLKYIKNKKVYIIQEKKLIEYLQPTIRIYRRRSFYLLIILVF